VSGHSYSIRSGLTHPTVQYVKSHLVFGQVVWSTWMKADKDCLEKVQKRAIRIVSGSRSETNEYRLRQLSFISFQERKHSLDMLQTYKVLKGHGGVKSDTWFQMASDRKRVTRLTTDP
jgi:hypothetical protein